MKCKMCVAKKEGLTEPIVLEDMCDKCRKSIGIIKEDENLAKKLLGYTLTSALTVGAYALTAHIKRNRTEQQAGKHGKSGREFLAESPQPTFMWISADSLFEVGEEVRIQDPFTLEVKDVGTYVVIEKFYVKEDFSFYYRLENASTGEPLPEPYAEDWLVEADLDSNFSGKEAIALTEKSKAKAEAEQAEQARKFQIDYHLAWLHDAKESGNTKAYAEAEAELKRLTDTESNEEAE